MDLSLYKQLTGLCTDESDAARTAAQIVRTQYMLEAMLGFTLDPTLTIENLYEELGKTQTDCFCTSVDVEDLDAPDAVIGAYRLFDYNEKDVFLAIDPFTEIHAVKLVKGNVTIKTFDADDYHIHRSQGIAKYLDVRCKNCFCTCDCHNCVQLAVDADWLWEGDLPSDLLFAWSEMITYHADLKRDIRSQSLDTHSWTKFDRPVPELETSVRKILMKYAGANGSIGRMPTE